MSTFTVYRPTKDFMDTLNTNDEHLKLHMARSFAFNQRGMINAAQHMLNMGALVPAATVDCDLTALFKTTNSIHDVWTKNEEVTLLTAASTLFLSSSSIGDVFKAEDGQMLMVCLDEILPVDITAP
jgi:hypothetical protein